MIRACIEEQLVHRRRRHHHRRLVRLLQQLLLVAKCHRRPLKTFYSINTIRFH